MPQTEGVSDVNVTALPDAPPLACNPNIAPGA